MAKQEDDFKKVISHAKEYDYVFQSFEIYDELDARFWQSVWFWWNPKWKKINWTKQIWLDKEEEKVKALREQINSSIENAKKILGKEQ